MFNNLLLFFNLYIIDRFPYMCKQKWAISWCYRYRAGYLIIIYLLKKLLSAFPPLPPIVGNLLSEYLTPMGHGVKEACENARKISLELLNVSHFQRSYIG